MRIEVLKSAIVPLFFSVVMASCDSGDIEESKVTISSSGRTVKLTARMTGVSSWAESNRNVVLAGFSNDNEYAVTQRAIPATTQDGELVEMVLDNLGASVDRAELAITNSLRKRIITLESIDLNDYESNTPYDTIYMDLGDIEVDLFGCMQYGLFNKACVTCHGANGSSAAGANLTVGNAYSSLVDVPSSSLEGYYRVLSGDPENSLMRIILNEGGENVLNYNHTEVLSSSFKWNLSEVRQLIDDWIVSLK